MRTLLGNLLVVAASSQLMAQAISVPPRPSRPPPRSPSGCCAYYDGLVAYDYAAGPAVQVAGTLAPTAEAGSLVHSGPGA